MPAAEESEHEPIYFFIGYPAAADVDHHNLHDRAVGIEGPLDSRCLQIQFLAVLAGDIEQDPANTDPSWY